MLLPNELWDLDKIHRIASCLNMPPFIVSAWHKAARRTNLAQEMFTIKPRTIWSQEKIDTLNREFEKDPCKWDSQKCLQVAKLIDFTEGLVATWNAAKNRMTF